MQENGFFYRSLNGENLFPGKGRKSKMAFLSLYRKYRPRTLRIWRDSNMLSGHYKMPLNRTGLPMPIYLLAPGEQERLLQPGFLPRP